MAFNHLSELSPLMAFENENGSLSILKSFMTLVDKPHSYSK